MYVVRNKKDKKTIHVNPAPLSQRLDGADVYYAFEPEEM